MTAFHLVPTWKPPPFPFLACDATKQSLVTDCQVNIYFICRSLCLFSSILFFFISIATPILYENFSMPWKDPQFLVFDSAVRGSFIRNNLTYDGHSYLVMASGKNVHCVRLQPSMIYSPDFPVERIDSDQVVTAIHFWEPKSRESNPYLVLGTSLTDEEPASVEIWDTAQGSQGAVLQVLTFEDGEDNIRFISAVGSVHCDDLGSYALAGSSNGTIFLIGENAKKKGEFNITCRLKGLTGPVTSVSGDVARKSYVTGVDELGNVAVWKLEKKGPIVKSKIVYQFTNTEDFVEVVSLRRAVIICGHSSGKLTFHHVGHGFVFAEYYTNSRRITCLESFEPYNWVIVGGEDCRITILQIPVVESEAPSKVLFSLCLNASAMGITFVDEQGKTPSFAMLPYDMPYLIYYQYEKSPEEEEKHKQKEQRVQVEEQGQAHTESMNSRISLPDSTSFRTAD